MKKQAVIILGSITDGIERIIGPFQDGKEAEEYGNGMPSIQAGFPFWHVCFLEEPSVPAKEKGGVIT